MRRRAMAAWALLAAGLAVAGAGAAMDTPPQALHVLAGALLLGAAGVALSLLPAWSRVKRLPPVAGLWQRPGAGERWCGRCGRPAPAAGPCPSCGAAQRGRRKASRGLHVKRSPRSQERKP